MQIYIIKRILMTLLVLLLVVIFLSLLVHIVPGDPVRTILGPRASPGLIQQMRTAMDLDKPIYMQIWHFLLNILHGSLGTDAVTGAPIIQADRQPVAQYHGARHHQPVAWLCSSECQWGCSPPPIRTHWRIELWQSCPSL